VALAVAIVLILRKVPPAYVMIAGAMPGGLCGGADLVQTVTLMIGGAHHRRNLGADSNDRWRQSWQPDVAEPQYYCSG